jgi:hypothetical protein
MQIARGLAMHEFLTLSRHEDIKLIRESNVKDSMQFLVFGESVNNVLRCVWSSRTLAITSNVIAAPRGTKKPCSRLLTSVDAVEESCA